MKPIDNTKVIDLNTKLDEKFKEERQEWNTKILELIRQLSDKSKLTDIQVTQLSYRQMLQEKLAEYRMFISQREEIFAKCKSERFREYTLNYDIKLSGTTIYDFVDSDYAPLIKTINLLKTEVGYLEQSVKTLDNLGFAVKNTIEIISQQIS